MEVERVYESSNMTNINTTVLLPNDKLSTPSGVLDCLWMSNSSPSFHDPASMVNFEDCRGEIAKEMSFFPTIEKEAETSNDDFDSGCFHQPEKKRRLLPNQVQFLERSFEVENKLEPERKVQLAKELGLQPRQVAIWFQNRRARYKTKQLEKDYDALKASFDKLKADYDTLFKENENLRNEVHLLTEKYHTSENSISESISPLVTEETQKATPIVVTSDVPIVVCKQEDATSAKSDVLDSDSPTHYSSFFEPAADSSHVYEQEPSDFSQDEDDNLRKTLLPPLYLPKIGEQIQANSCNLGFQIEDQPYWSWQY